MKKEITIHGQKFEQFIKAETIAARVKQIAHSLNETATEDTVFVILLNGAFVFAADLMRELNFTPPTLFIKVTSYHGLDTTGEVQFDHELIAPLRGKKIIIIEDIIDTGTTLHHFIASLSHAGVADVQICSLLYKPNKLKHPIKIDHIGFEIGDLFVIGYGLDYDEVGRNLRDIYVIC
jgi:hypoxanthine phosphoribosyltransferase